MNPPKCTCRCTCKSAQHSNMGNAKRNSSCSLQTPVRRKSDQLQSSNPNELHFTAEQQNMILKIEACNREILQEIYRLQSESVKTNDAISLLKEHANVIQTSCLSPRLPQREFPTYPSVVYNKKSSISGSSTSSSGIRDNSSTCVNDDSRVINYTQQTVKRNEDQITRQLELLRDRQFQLMLKIESLKRSRFILVHNMHQLLLAAKMQKTRQGNECCNKKESDTFCNDCNQETTFPLKNNGSDQNEPKYPFNLTNSFHDSTRINPEMSRSYVDRECQTVIDPGSRNDFSMTKTDSGLSHNVGVFSESEQNPTTVYSNNERSNSTMNPVSNSQTNMSALAMVAAVTAATIFRKTLQQSTNQIANNYSEIPGKHDSMCHSYLENKCSSINTENPRWRDYERLETLKKNYANEVSEEGDNHLSQTLCDQLTEIMDRFDLSSPPPPAPNSSLYGFTEINPCSNYADVKYKQNSNLQLKNTSSEEEFDLSLEPDYFQIGQEKSKLPQRISLEHYDTESNRDDEPKLSLNSSDMIRNTGLNVSREKFSDRLLRARQAIDLWECQVNRDSYEKGSHVPFPDVGQNQQLKLNSDTKAATLPQVSSSVNANFPTRCNSLTNKLQTNERIAPFQGFTSVDTHSNAKTSYQKDNLSTLHPSSSKAMPVQIVKPAVRNQNINNPYKDNDVKQSTKISENQITNHQTQPIESHHQQTQNNKPTTYVDKTSNNDRRQIKGVLVSENSKGERTSRTSRNPSTQRSVAWVDEVLSHPLSNSTKIEVLDSYEKQEKFNHTTQLEKSHSTSEKSSNNSTQDSERNVSSLTKKSDTTRSNRLSALSSAANSTRRLLPNLTNTKLNDRQQYK
ncbi:unnamed protein product [Trichobilharzia szidati]|nr:unnamed protein product [Trichobilharzia szidati]